MGVCYISVVDCSVQCGPRIRTSSPVIIHEVESKPMSSKYEKRSAIKLFTYPRPSHKLFYDLTGSIIGRWSVLSYAGRSGTKHQWNCICRCGVAKIVKTESLTSGRSLSCGCLKKESLSARRFIDLAGKKFGRLTVGPHHQIVAKRTMWTCLCECGTITAVEYGNLTSGRTASCGCLLREATASRSSKHSMLNSAEYYAWRNMKQRCENPKHRNYKSYGAIGVSVCEQWRQSFETFYKDMGPRPTSDHRLDRFPDIAGPYSPTNCRWFQATK